MEVKDFFEEENIVDFDFVQEVLSRVKVKGEESDAKKKKYLESKDPIEKYILYKTYFKKSDPDSNDGLLKDIYEDRWDPNILKCCLHEKVKYCSDTMTSVQGLIHRFYQEVLQEEFPHSREKEINFSTQLLKEIYQSPNQYPVFKTYFIDDSTISNFMKRYHTLGNYIPVPPGFNAARSGMYASHDMWDLTLMKIRDYYHEKNRCQFSKEQKELLELLHFYDTVESTKNWLDAFGSWENFVDKNYLKKEDGLDNYVNSDYTIDPFFEEKHCFDYPELKRKEDYLEYFKRITQIIEDRSKIIKKAYDEKREK